LFTGKNVEVKHMIPLLQNPRLWYPQGKINITCNTAIPESLLDNCDEQAKLNKDLLFKFVKRRLKLSTNTIIFTKYEETL